MYCRNVIHAINLYRWSPAKDNTEGSDWCVEKWFWSTWAHSRKAGVNPVPGDTGPMRLWIPRENPRDQNHGIVSRPACNPAIFQHIKNTRRD